MVSALIESLREDLGNGQVVVIAGTGVSAASCGNLDIATWRGLLLSGVQRCIVFSPPSAQVGEIDASHRSSPVI